MLAGAALGPDENPLTTVRVQHHMTQHEAAERLFGPSLITAEEFQEVFSWTNILVWQPRLTLVRLSIYPYTYI